MEGSPGKLNIVVPSVKKSTYFEPMTCTSFNAGVVEAVSAAAVLEADVERFGPMSGIGAGLAIDTRALTPKNAAAFVQKYHLAEGHRQRDRNSSLYIRQLRRTVRPQSTSAPISLNGILVIVPFAYAEYTQLRAL
jgi:hypothetical protein